MDAVVRVVLAAGGVTQAKVLLAAGLNAGQIRRAVANGSLVRLARGIYALPDADASVAFARIHHAQLGCVSAAAGLQLWVVRKPLQLHVAADHSRSIPGCIVHRSPLPLTGLDVVSQCLRCLPAVEALTIAESAVKSGLVPLHLLRSAFQGRRDRRISDLICRINPQSESIIETMARYHLEQAGFNVQVQVKVAGMGHLDLMVDGILGLETDGFEGHSSRQAYREDRRRWNLTVIRGIPTLRIPFEMIANDPETFLRTVREAMAAVLTIQSAR